MISGSNDFLENQQFRFEFSRICFIKVVCHDSKIESRVIRIVFIGISFNRKKWVPLIKRIKRNVFKINFDLKLFESLRKNIKQQKQFEISVLYSIFFFTTLIHLICFLVTRQLCIITTCLKNPFLKTNGLLWDKCLCNVYLFFIFLIGYLNKCLCLWFKGTLMHIWESSYMFVLK